MTLLYTRPRFCHLRCSYCRVRFQSAAIYETASMNADSPNARPTVQPERQHIPHTVPLVAMIKLQKLMIHRVPG